MADRAVAIFTAVQTEARAVATALGVAAPTVDQPTVGLCGNTPIQLHLIGIRAPRLPVLDPVAVRCIIVAGLAGALDPSLRVGDLVVAGLGEGLQEGLRCRFGDIHASAAVVATPQEKAALYARTGALAADMEYDIVRGYAGRLGVPLVAVRAISDTAADFLDPALVRIVDEFGRARPRAIAAMLLGRPSMLPRLVQLAGNVRLAARRLAEIMPDLVSRL